METIDTNTAKNGAIHLKQKELVITSLLGVLKTRNQQTDEIKKEFAYAISDIEKKGSIDWPKILSQILEMLQGKNKRIKDLEETIITLAKENSKLSSQIRQIDEKLVHLTDMNMDILMKAQKEKETFQKTVEHLAGMNLINNEEE